MGEINEGDALKGVKDITVEHIFPTVQFFWKHHKIFSSIFILFSVIIGYGGATYLKLQNDAKSYNTIKDEYNNLRTENLELRKKAGELELEISKLISKDVHYESVLSLATEVETHLAGSAYAIASLLHGSTEVHEGQILQPDQKTGDAFGEFSEFLLKFDKLIRKVRLISKSASEEYLFMEPVFYTLLKGKYYAAADLKGSIRAEMAKRDFFTYVNLYNDRFSKVPELCHYGKFMAGLYYILPNNLNYKLALNNFGESIKCIPTGSFWPAPHYHQLLVYEKTGDIPNFLKKAEELRKLFKESHRMHHPMYLSTLIALIEGTIPFGDTANQEIEELFEEFNQILNSIQDEKDLTTFKYLNDELNILRKVIEVCSLLSSYNYADMFDVPIIPDLKSIKLLLNNEEKRSKYYKKFIALTNIYVELLYSIKFRENNANDLFKKINVYDEAQSDTRILILRLKNSAREAVKLQNDRLVWKKLP